MSLARLGETLRAFGRIQRDRLQTSASADRDGLGRAAAHSAPQVGSDSVGCAMTENTLRAYDVDCGKPVGRTEIDGRPVLLRCCKQAGHDVGCEWQARGRVPLDLRCYPSTTHAVGGAGIVVSEAKRRCPQGFYRHIGMRDYGLDAGYSSLRYFEFDVPAARSFSDGR